VNALGGSASVTTSASATQPSSIALAFSSAARVRRNLRPAAAGTNTPLYFLTLTPRVNTTFTGSFSGKFTLPTSSFPSGTNLYVGVYYPGATTWLDAVAGPATVTSLAGTTTASFTTASTTFTMFGGKTYGFALYYTSGSATPVPLPVVPKSTPTPPATPTPPGVPSTVKTVKTIPTPAPTPTPVPGQPTPKPTTAADKKTQGAIQSALGGTKTAKSVGKTFKPGKTPLGFRRVAALLASRKTQSVRYVKDESGCTDGLVEAVTANPDGTTTVEDATYADTACATNLVSDATSTYSVIDGNGNQTAIGATVNYKSDGVTVEGYDVINMTLYGAGNSGGSTDIVQSTTHYPDVNTGLAGGIPLGIDYSATIENGSTITTSTASLIDDVVAGVEFGTVNTLNITITGSDGSGDQTTTSTGTTTVVSDPTYSLAIATFPLAVGADTWSITGGAAVATTSQTQSTATDSGGEQVSDQQSITDSGNDSQITFSNSGPGTGYTGTITKISTGATVGTITTDDDGNGTVTFADGSTAAVTQFGLSG
jgi:hypothetical protein